MGRAPMQWESIECCDIWPQTISFLQMKQTNDTYLEQYTTQMNLYMEQVFASNCGKSHSCHGLATDACFVSSHESVYALDLCVLW